MTTTRISTATDGTQANGQSSTVSTGFQVSADGRYVVFQSSASNLVAGDTNGAQDIFIKDLLTGTISRVSTASDGTQADNSSANASISADGTRVAFQSSATNLVAGDTNGAQDIFVKNLTTGAITRVSTDSTSTQGNDNSTNASISADGTRVAFQSTASNLVSGDTNSAQDIFIKNLTTGAITRVSTNSAGAQGDSSSANASISADGTRVAFVSSGTNLVAGDTNSANDVFVKDLPSGTTTRVSTDSAGAQALGGASNPSISADGTRIAFLNSASNLVAGDTNGVSDIFVKDLPSGTTTRVSTNSAGGQATGNSLNASISADGTRVAFESNASNLVAGDTNGVRDIFVKDLPSGTTTRVSTNSAGAQATNNSVAASISGDGTRVAFASAATNLVPGDTNGVFDVFVADVVCYAAGTAIRVLRAGAARDVAVEDLVVGDQALTASGRARPIRWLGHRTLPCRGRADLQPVRIAAHAFGPDKPARDLLVSPAHALCVDLGENLGGEVLIPAVRLLNGTTVTRVPLERVTYWHVELDGHDLLLAENMPAESYLDVGNRGFFVEAPISDLTLGPDAPAGHDRAGFCRPLHEVGPEVEAARAHLRARAEAVGWTLAQDPLADLRLVADGTVIRPDVADLSAHFVIPTGAREVCLVSDVSTPADILADTQDRRRLGLALAALDIEDGLTGTRTRVALDDARLARGFHAMEADGEAAWRWTDGAAILPPALWADCAGTVIVRVRLARPALPRWVRPAAGVARRVA